MAHFAELDNENIVLRVLVTNDDFTNEGYDWLIENLGGVWVKTSYNTYSGVHLLGGIALRKNFASVGFTYDESLDAFIPQKPFESWVLIEQTCQWEAPTARPQDEKNYSWNESTLSWVEITGE